LIEPVRSQTARFVTADYPDEPARLDLLGETGWIDASMNSPPLGRCTDRQKGAPAGIGALGPAGGMIAFGRGGIVRVNCLPSEKRRTVARREMSLVGGPLGIEKLTDHIMD
jgi:hypothetical protein